MMAKALKILLLVISLTYISGVAGKALFAQAKAPADIGYGEPEETDFC